ncbi:MAG: StlD/DarB family beta-ketosynthase [Planctomycetes bacterium]|nr:StlD/DarB family beta-ketosynthase [Planctomycetota bacterium]
MPAYINGVGVCLPNKPVHNEKIEAVLGMIGQSPSPLRDVVLERNGIKWRYYALDPVTGEPTHTNAELTAEAIRTLVDSAGVTLDEIGLLACGTSSPDQAIPSHACMVHGLVGCPVCECVSTAGVCCSGMAALKYAYLSVLAGAVRSAVVTGSELVSLALRASEFPATRHERAAQDPYLGFSREFLRFMLSDGAGAVLIESEPRAGALALKIEWVDMRSFAHELDACMYSGAVKQTDGSLRSWRMAERDPADAARKGYFNLFQDVSLLGENIVPTAGRFFADVLRRRGLTAADVDWLLPHISSMFFQQPLYEQMARIGFDFPVAKWFTNLRYKGNTGAASIFIMLEELYRSGKLRPGHRILCAVPESARFTFACMYLTVQSGES